MKELTYQEQRDRDRANEAADADAKERSGVASYEEAIRQRVQANLDRQDAAAKAVNHQSPKEFLDAYRKLDEPQPCKGCESLRADLAAGRSLVLSGVELESYLRLRKAAQAAQAAQAAMGTASAELRDAFQLLCAALAPGSGG